MFARRQEFLQGLKLTFSGPSTSPCTANIVWISSAICRIPTGRGRCDGRHRFRASFAYAGDREGRAMIKKVAGGYKVLSEKGKNLGGPYKTKAAAEKRLRQVEFFKHKKG
jgi:hypothetical protein